MAYILSRALHAGAALHDRGVTAINKIGVLPCFLVLFVGGALLAWFTPVGLDVGMGVFFAFCFLSMCEMLVKGATWGNPFAFMEQDETEAGNSVLFTIVGFAPMLGVITAAISRPYVEGAGQ